MVPCRAGQLLTQYRGPPRRADDGKMGRMAGLKDRLRADLTAGMKARDEVRIRTLRMALTSIANEEVAGKQARDLGDDEVLRLLTREAKRRRGAADAFEGAGRRDQAAAERAEDAVLADYRSEERRVGKECRSRWS